MTFQVKQREYPLRAPTRRGVEPTRCTLFVVLFSSLGLIILLSCTSRGPSCILPAGNPAWASERCLSRARALLSHPSALRPRAGLLSSPSQCFVYDDFRSVIMHVCCNLSFRFLSLLGRSPWCGLHMCTGCSHSMISLGGLSNKTFIKIGFRIACLRDHQ